MIYSFVFFLVLFVLVGVASARYSRKTTEDYLLASKSVHPVMAGFSMFATESSAFMFVGYIGIVYAMGVSGLWFLLGWYPGVILVSILTAHKIRVRTDETGAQTYSELISRWTGEDYKLVRYVLAGLTIVFLSVYAAAQLSGGGKALNVLAGWDLNFSAFIGFLMVLIYCLAGGIRATIWTDSLQAVVMFVSLFLIVGYSLNEIGGFEAMNAALRDIDPALLDMFGGSYKFGVLGFFLGWLFGGIGVLGQPQVMVRFMVLDKAENARFAIGYYAFMVSVLAALTTIAGLCARVLLPELLEGDPELSLPLLSAAYMPGVLSGLFLAGLFAAAMSTADSQILSSAAALIHDILPRFKDNVLWSKFGTVFVAVLALFVAIFGDKNVFKLATFAWAVMAAGFAPLLLVYIWGRRPSQAHALAMMAGGVAASLWWEFAGLSGDLYNVLPGIATGLLLYFIPAMFMRGKGDTK